MLITTDFYNKLQSGAMPVNKKVLLTEISITDILNSVPDNDFVSIFPNFSTETDTSIGFAIKNGDQGGGIVYDSATQKWVTRYIDSYNLASKDNATASNLIFSITYPQSDGIGAFNPIEQVENIPRDAWLHLKELLNSNTSVDISNDPYFEVSKCQDKNIYSGSHSIYLFLVTYDTTQDCVITSITTKKYDRNNLILVNPELAKAMFDYTIEKNGNHYLIEFIWHGWGNEKQFLPYASYIPV